MLPAETIAHLRYGRRLLRCGILKLLMSRMGHSRRFWHVRDTSAYPPLATEERTFQVGSFVPIPVVSRCSKTLYSITSSARASNVGGMVRPSVLAVFRLMTSSTLAAC